MIFCRDALICLQSPGHFSGFCLTSASMRTPWKALSLMLALAVLSAAGFVWGPAGAGMALAVMASSGIGYLASRRRETRQEPALRTAPAPASQFSGSATSSQPGPSSLPSTVPDAPPSIPAGLATPRQVTASTATATHQPPRASDGQREGAPSTVPHPDEADHLEALVEQLGTTVLSDVSADTGKQNTCRHTEDSFG